MIEGEPLVLPPEAAGAAKSYLRIERPDEDALLASLVTSAAELCESFTGQALIARGFVETLAAADSVRAWRRLGRTPVRAITAVEAAPLDAPPAPLPSGSYAIDIDGNGDGWVRVASGSAPRVRVAFQAGLSADWAGLPGPLKQGITRLAAHLYSHRSGDSAPNAAAEPPAAVTALWRPYRRMRLG